MGASHNTVEEKTNQIEAEMKRIGMWQQEPLKPEQLDFHRAFGGDTMAFEQWLQFIFIPRVRQIIAENGMFPSKSQVGDQAFREWKMWGDQPNVDDLIAMLKGFDSLFGY
jgi:uncharacterized protein YqcC (DUF446 family)